MNIADEFFEKISLGDLDRTREILEGQPELLRVRDTRGDTGLHVAVESLQGRVAGLLLEAGSDPNARDGAGRSVLESLRAVTGDAAARDELETLLRKHGAKD